MANLETEMSVEFILLLFVNKRHSEQLQMQQWLCYTESWQSGIISFNTDDDKHKKHWTVKNYVAQFELFKIQQKQFRYSDVMHIDVQGIEV